MFGTAGQDRSASSYGKTKRVQAFVPGGKISKCLLPCTTRDFRLVPAGSSKCRGGRRSAFFCRQGDEKHMDPLFMFRQGGFLL